MAISGELVFGGEHPTKYVLVPGTASGKLLVMYSGFGPPGEPKYSFIKVLAAVACDKLWILDDLGPAGEERGCYYLGSGRDLQVARSSAALVDDLLAERNLSRSDVLACGTSKGGTAALYHAFTLGYGTVFAGAPQTFIARYLADEADPPVPEVMELIAGGRTEEDRAWLDGVLFEAIRNSVHRPELHLFSSPQDHQLEGHVHPLTAELDRLGIAYTLDLGSYPRHSAVGPQYARWLLAHLERLGLTSSAAPAPARAVAAPPPRARVSAAAPAQSIPSTGALPHIRALLAQADEEVNSLTVALAAAASALSGRADGESRATGVDDSRLRQAEERESELRLRLAELDIELQAEREARQAAERVASEPRR